MKHFLFVVAMLFGILTLSAQQYDEVNLLGTWLVTDQTGEISNTVKSFEKITFGETQFFEYDYSVGNDTWYNPRNTITPNGVIYNTTALYYRYYDGQMDLTFRTNPTRQMTDYLITNGNKLHIQFSDYEIFYMRFVIKKLTKSELVLENYTGTCELTLTRESASKVEAINLEEKNVPEYYSINGIKIENPDKGIFVEKTGNESHLIAK